MPSMTTSQAFHTPSVLRRLKFTGTFSPVDRFTSVRTVAMVSPGSPLYGRITKRSAVKSTNAAP